MIKLYNTLTRQKEVFTPLSSPKVGVYSCGPTVYDRQHIGNMRPPVFADILTRVLQAEDYDVTKVMNITDVGHLTDDQSDGDDKMEKAAAKTGKSALDIARTYEDLFFIDLDKLNVVRPTIAPRATEHITEQIAMIQTMEKKGFTYIIDDGVYFDTSKLPEYGILSGQKVEEKEEGARVAVNAQKRNPADFALWKFSPYDEKRQMEWSSPWGTGFPGWHIECSAMSEKYLGVPFDIHTGGVDHIAVHHENELAQTRAAFGCLEANMWLHNEFITVDGGKMSKSLGNTYSLDDLIARNIEPLALRYLFLGARYSSSINFTWDAIQAAHNALRNLRDLAKPLPAAPLEVSPVAEFFALIADDLDTPKALAFLWDALRGATLSPVQKANLVAYADSFFALNLVTELGASSTPQDIPVEVQELLGARAAAREKKDFALSDRLRDEIAILGFSVKDAPDGQVLTKIN
jgi:cysteinyl-tRNA synthetase